MFTLWEFMVAVITRIELMTFSKKWLEERTHYPFKLCEHKFTVAWNVVGPFSTTIAM